METTGHKPGSPRDLDEEIRRHIMRGDLYQALDVLVQAYEQRIVSFCVRFLAESALAQEVAQDVFLAAFEAMSRFRGEASVQTWLYGIARNKCLQAYRQRRRQVFLHSRYRTDIAESVHPSQEASPNAGDPCVAYALRRLQVHYRQVLHLRYVENLLVKDVTQIMGGVAEKTILRWSAQAVLDFRKFYERCMHRETST